MILFICCMDTCCFSQDTLTKKDWEELSPYLLSDDHPAKPSLDNIFSNPNVLASKDMLIQSGFRLAGRGCTVLAMKHPKLNGYIVKTFTEDNKKISCEWEHFLKRIRGAKVIRDGILKYHLGNIMKVPKKWIYQLPHNNFDGMASFALVAEDMKILDDDTCKYFYKYSMKKTLLKAIFKLVTKYGLSDSCQIANIPICEDGKIAFVDTENYQNRFVQYLYIHEHLSKANLKYWKSLVKKKRKKR
jgi:hypothetical protein